MGEETDETFLQHVLGPGQRQGLCGPGGGHLHHGLHPFHGTGYQQIPYVLGQLGVKHLHCVPEQMVIDGTFPTVKSPNPETPESFALAQKLAKEVDADLILGSDPDADRVAIQVKGKDGAYVQISGNQTGVLLLDYLIGAKKRAGTLPDRPVALKSLVTTDLAGWWPRPTGVESYNTFTGFKFMAEKKNQLEAIAGACDLLLRGVHWIHDRGLCPGQGRSHRLPPAHGDDGLVCQPGDDPAGCPGGHLSEVRLLWGANPEPGDARIGEDGQHEGHHGRPPANAPGRDCLSTPVACQKDYQDGTARDTATGAVTQMELVGSNVLAYDLADGTTIVVRPSGTEPKIKVYLLTKGDSHADCQSKVDRYRTWAEGLAR